MKEFGKRLRQKPWFERVYKIGVGIKGIDGLIELAVGISLWISPRIVHMVLSAAVGEANKHHVGVFRFIAEYIARVDSDLTKGGLSFFILFLIVHGVVKLVLVYCLLKEIVRVYPVALAILTIFLLYQVYVLIVQPSIGIALFTLLDVVIIWLVWGEYQELRTKK